MPGPIEIVHLSDLHIRSDKAAGGKWGNRGLRHAGLRTQILVNHIDRNLPDAHVVITGDVMDSGNPAQHDQAVDILSPWLKDPKRLSVVPGNHDVRTYGNIPKSGRQHLFWWIYGRLAPGAKDYPWVKYIDHLALIGLDSTADRSWNTLAKGSLGEEQLERLAKILNRTAVLRRVPVLLLHHHPWDFGPATVMVDADDLMDELNAYEGRYTPLVLFGHRHDTGQWVRASGRYVASPTSVGVWRNSLSFRVIRISPGGKVNIRWEYVPVSVEGGITVGPADVECPMDGEFYEVGQESGEYTCPGCDSEISMELGVAEHAPLLLAECPETDYDFWVEEESSDVEEGLTCPECRGALIVDTDESDWWVVYHDVSFYEDGDYLTFECPYGENEVQVIPNEKYGYTHYRCPDCHENVAVVLDDDGYHSVFHAIDYDF